jgi:coenzyme F420-0:L-glutamate ligase / coenzyme F420-1:gamma-L-glutamate ligase
MADGIAWEISILGLKGIPEVTPGDDPGVLITQALRGQRLQPGDGDVLVVAHKIVSKAEGRLVRLETVTPSAEAETWARQSGKDARVVEIVYRESRRIVKAERGVLIAETRHGFVCANAGVDVSNVPPGFAALLPLNPDESARRIRNQVEEQFGARPAVIISDTFGRPWREGLVNVAVGVCGLNPLEDYRGKADTFGRRLCATVIAAADELAAAAELVMGKTRAIPVALIRGFDYHEGKQTARQMIRPAERDLFR